MLPDEAADHANAALAQGRELLELVVLVAEQHLDPVSLDPGDVLLERHLEGRGLGDSRLVPDPGPLEHAGPRPLLAPGPGEHEALMPQLLDRRAHIAPNDRLPPVEPLRHDADAHHGMSSAAPCGHAGNGVGQSIRTYKPRTSSASRPGARRRAIGRGRPPASPPCAGIPPPHAPAARPSAGGPAGGPPQDPRRRAASRTGSPPRQAPRGRALGQRRSPAPWPRAPPTRSYACSCRPCGCRRGGSSCAPCGAGSGPVRGGRWGRPARRSASSGRAAPPPRRC